MSCVFFLFFFLSFFNGSQFLGMTGCSGVARRAVGRASTSCRGYRFIWGPTTERNPSFARRRIAARSSPLLETWRTTGAYTQVRSSRYPGMKEPTCWRRKARQAAGHLSLVPFNASAVHSRLEIWGVSSTGASISPQQWVTLLSYFI